MVACSASSTGSTCSSTKTLNCRSTRKVCGDSEKDRNICEQDSPITYIHGVKAPLLVLQGDNDPRVPKEEAEQVDSLKKDGKIVDEHYYANEGHGFEKL